MLRDIFYAAIHAHNTHHRITEYFGGFSVIQSGPRDSVELELEFYWQTKMIVSYIHIQK